MQRVKKMSWHLFIFDPAVSALRCAIAKVKQRWSFIGWVTKINYLEFLPAVFAVVTHQSALCPHWVMARFSCG
jgi:hypothetical protein